MGVTNNPIALLTHKGGTYFRPEIYNINIMSFNYCPVAIVLEY